VQDKPALLEIVETPTVLRALEQWTRRRLRAIAWKQWKRGRTRFAQLIKRGVDVALAAFLETLTRSTGVSP
jgi:hypothetical protein